MGGKVIERDQWADHPELWKGEFQGGVYGTDVPVVFYTTNEIGGGPQLHNHSCAEAFIIRIGRALFTLGDEKMEAMAGQDLGRAGRHAAQVRESRTGPAGDDGHPSRRQILDRLPGVI